jgi:hypothetical protein
MGRRKPCFNFFDAFCGRFVIVGGGCFGEPVKDGAQDLFLSGEAVVQTARRPRSCHPVVAVLRLWVITLGALPGAMRMGGVFGLLHGVSGMVVLLNCWLTAGQSAPPRPMSYAFPRVPG